MHNDGERHIPYIMIFPDSVMNKMRAWASFQLPNGMIQEQLRCGCYGLPIQPIVSCLHTLCIATCSVYIVRTVVRPGLAVMVKEKQFKVLLVVCMLSVYAFIYEPVVYGAFDGQKIDA